MTSFQVLQHGTCTPDISDIMLMSSRITLSDGIVTSAKVNNYVRAAAFSAGQLSTLAVVRGVYYS